MSKKSRKKHIHNTYVKKEQTFHAERKSLFMRLYDMTRHHSSSSIRGLVQMRLLLLGLLVILTTAFVAYLFVQLFYLASYRFVALFLLLILASHLLAKISRVYIRV